jgi:hypothetical protein
MGRRGRRMTREPEDLPFRKLLPKERMARLTKVYLLLFPPAFYTGGNFYFYQVCERRKERFYYVKCFSKKYLKRSKRL